MTKRWNERYFKESRIKNENDRKKLRIKPDIKKEK